MAKNAHNHELRIDVAESRVGTTLIQIQMSTAEFTALLEAARSAAPDPSDPSEEYCVLACHLVEGEPRRSEIAVRSRGVLEAIATATARAGGNFTLVRTLTA